MKVVITKRLQPGVLAITRTLRECCPEGKVPDTYGDTPIANKDDSIIKSDVKLRTRAHTTKPGLRQCMHVIVNVK